MKKSLLIFLLVAAAILPSHSQTLLKSLAARTTVPDYTFNDAESGISYSFLGILNQGKVIFTTASPIWCPYCYSNTKADLNNTVMSKYDLSKVAFIHNIYDTDNAGAVGDRNSMNIDGRALVYVQGGDEDTRYCTALGVPGYMILDPKTKKVVYVGGPFTSMSENLAIVDQLLAGTFVYPDQENNIAYNKPVTMTGSMDKPHQAPGNINDGMLFSYSFGSENPSWIIDFEQSYNVNKITVVGPETSQPTVKVSLSESPTGPWTVLSNLALTPSAKPISANVIGKGRYCKIESAAGDEWNFEIGEFKAFTSDGIVDLVAPTAPSALTATAKTATSFTLNWTASTDAVGVVGYDVYKNGTLLGSTTTATSYAVTGLTASTAYAMTVKARDAKPNTSAAGALSVTTNALSSDVIAPSVPTNLSAASVTSSGLTLNWSASTDAVGVVGYDVYQGATLIGSPTTNSFAVTGLTASTAYSFTVKAKDAAGNTSAASAALPVTTAANVVVPPGAGIATWDLIGINATGAATTAAVSTKDANLTVSNLTLAAGMGGQSASFTNSLHGSEMTSTSLTQSISNNEYLEFTITPASGKKVTVTSIEVCAISQGRTATCSLLSNVGGFTADKVISSIALGTPNEINVSNQTLAVTGITDRTSAVTFRFYFNAVVDQNYATFGIGERHPGETTAAVIVNGLVSMTTGVSNVNQAMLMLYPNPATDKLSLNFGTEFNSATISILDLQGRSMLNQTIDNTQVESLDISSLNSGIYFIKVIADGKVMNSKFVKK